MTSDRCLTFDHIKNDFEYNANNIININKHRPTVYIDGRETPYSYIYAEMNKKTITCTYIIDKTEENENWTGSNTVRVSIDSNNRLIQANFQHDEKCVSVVNARNCKLPVMFDGFVSPDDEACTTPFRITRLKSLPEEHNLNVRQMVKAMQSDTLLKINIYEAIVTNEHIQKKWYKNLWFTSSAVHHLADTKFTIWTNDARRKRKINQSRWAPVECDEGALILSLELVFRYV